MHQYLYVSLPGITTHTIICTSTCMLVCLVLLHIQYYAPIPVCLSTWYYYTYNTIHQYLHVSLPGITTHTILCTNTCMLVLLVLLHIQYYSPIHVCQSTCYYYTYNAMHQYLYVSLPGITTHTILCTNTCMLV
jgi:ABC-type arginine transport system permease subunit